MLRYSRISQSKRCPIRIASVTRLQESIRSRVARSLRGALQVLLVLLTLAIGERALALPDVVVMIHGAGGGGWEYDRWKPLFTRKGWQVIAPDLMPGKGGLEQTGFDDYLQQIVRCVPVKRRRLVLIGASMGGVLALKAAEKLGPDAIVLVNSAPPMGVGPLRADKSYPPIIRWANGPIEDTRAALPDGDEATVQWAHPKWRDESGMVLNALRKGIPVEVPTPPVLAVLGGRDTDIPLETGLAIAKWSHADVHLYEDASHIGPLYGRRAAEIASATLLWLDAVQGRKSVSRNSVKWKSVKRNSVEK